MIGPVVVTLIQEYVTLKFRVCQSSSKFRQMSWSECFLRFRYISNGKQFWYASKIENESYNSRHIDHHVET